MDNVDEKLKGYALKLRFMDESYGVF